MMLGPTAAHPRRRVLAAGLAALAVGVTRTRPAGARAMFIRGMAGGGLARLDEGEEPRLANLSLFASSQQFPDGNTKVVGRIQWIEAGTELRLESTLVSQCDAMQDRPGGAEIRGRMSVNGEGDHPFVIEVFDTGAPGTGLDTIKLEVNTPAAREGAATGNDESDFTYAVSATIVAGDIEGIVVDLELDD